MKRSLVGAGLLRRAAGANFASIVATRARINYPLANDGERRIVGYAELEDEI